MNGYVICIVGLAGCGSAAPPVPPPATTATRAPADAAALDAAAPLTALDPESGPASDGPRCAPYDPANPTCRAACPPPPDPAIDACRQIMACPTPPDPWVVACGPMHHRPSVPRTARIVTVRIVPDGVLLTILVGTNDGITMDTSVEICDADLHPVLHGKVTVVRVNRQYLVGKTEIALDQLDDKRICLTPAP